MMKISVRQYRFLGNMLSRVCDSVNIYTLSDEEVLEYGVNWCAMGTQSAEKTLEYAEALQKAAEVAAALNKLELTVDWSDRPEPNGTEEEFQKFAESFVKILEAADSEFIELGLKKYDRVFSRRNEEV